MTLREILKNVPQEGGATPTARSHDLREASELLAAARGDASMLVAAGMDTATMLQLALERIHAVTSRVDSSVGDTEKRHGAVRVCRERPLHATNLLRRQGREGTWV